MPAAPSLLIVPYRSKTGKLYSQIPTSGAGDFTVTRNTTATRLNSAGAIESVASGIPRLDYLTSGGTVGCPALLVEPAATNGILNSTDTTTSWTLGANLTSGAIDVIGVSGNNLTVAVSGSGIGSAAGRFVRFNNNVALASGSTYTVSFLMKKTGAHTIGGYQLTMSSGVVGSGFDVSGSFASGSNVDTAPTTNRIRRIERFGTDVFRCSETFTMTAVATGTHLAFGPVSAVSVSTNSAVGTTMGFAAPQIELGSVPTSFIPTAAASGSRSGDLVSVTGAVSGSIGQTAGTFYLDLTYSLRLTSTATRWIQIFGSSNNIGLAVATTNIVRSIVNGQSDILSTPSTADGVKIAWGYDGSGVVCFVNGTQYTLTNGGAQIITQLNQISLDLSTTTNIGNCRLRAMALYTTRLTNAELATLTTP